MNGPGLECYRKRSPARLASVTFVWPLFSRDAMSTHTKTVAVVDDDRSMLVGVERLLNAYGYATKVFPSAEAFLAPGAETDADCLLLDVDLSGMSGIELRRRLAACGRAVPVIFMTALDDEATRASALETGCIAYLLKPFPSRSLIDAIKTAVALEE
jgi:FixJ family two-component response regulator